MYDARLKMPAKEIVTGMKTYTRIETIIDKVV